MGFFCRSVIFFLDGTLSDTEAGGGRGGGMLTVFGLISCGGYFFSRIQPPVRYDKALHSSILMPTMNLHYVESSIGCSKPQPLRHAEVQWFYLMGILRMRDESREKKANHVVDPFICEMRKRVILRRKSHNLFFFWPMVLFRPTHTPNDHSSSALHPTLSTFSLLRFKARLFFYCFWFVLLEKNKVQSSERPSKA